jgi:hypothetical protein
VEASLGQSTVNPWYSETKWKIEQEKKKREISTNSFSQPRPETDPEIPAL